MNVIISITDKFKDKYNSLLAKLGEDKDVKVYVGIEEKNASQMNEFQGYDNIFVSIFENGSSVEEMINALQKYVSDSATIVLRKPIKQDELYKFANCDADVATCEKTRSKTKNFFFNIWQAVLKLFLGVKEYEGDTSVVYLSEDISSVVNESGNLSFSTRANRWRGIEQTTIGVKDQPVKNEVDKKQITKLSLIASAAILLAIIVTTVVCLTVNVGIIVGLLLVCLDMICFAIGLLTLIIIVFNCRVGSKKVKEAKEKEYQVEKKEETKNEEG